MPNTFSSDSVWVDDIDTYETSTSLLGGNEDAPLNEPLRDVINRTQYNRDAIDSLGLSAQYGDGNFDPENGLTITHNLGHTDYAVTAHPTANPGGELGEVWIDHQENSFTIHNSGSWSGALRWGLTVGTEFGA